MSNLEFEEKVTAIEPLYHGAIIDVERQTVTLPNGEVGHREIVRHSGAVGVVAITPKNQLVLVKQWRAPIGKVTLEVPAGKLDDRDVSDPVHAANRELNEEVRLQAGHLEAITGFYTSIGFSDEYMTLYLATDLKPVDGALPRDFGENLSVDAYTLSELKNLMAEGAIEDAKTIMAIWYFELLQIKAGDNHQKSTQWRTKRTVKS